MRLFGSVAPESARSPGGCSRAAARPKWPRGRIQVRGGLGGAISILWQAGEKFAADDGWAIASYIGLSLLTSLFPFLIFVAALAGFLGSSELGERGGAARLRRMAGRRRAADRRRGPNVLTAPRGGLLTFGAVLSFYFASSAVEALRVGLNRAYGLVELRPWWRLRLQSLGLVLVGSLRAAGARLSGRARAADLVDTLAIYLPWVAAAHRAPDLRAHRRRRRRCSPTSLILAHLILPAHRPALPRHPAGRRDDLHRQHRLRRGFRRLSQRISFATTSPPTRAWRR